MNAFGGPDPGVTGVIGGGAAGDIRLDPVEAAIAELRRGRPVVVVDDAERENEGDVIMAAVHATPEWVAWSVRHGSGLLCAPMPGEWADRLALPAMVAANQDPRRTAYTVTVDAASGVTTGISATDRSRTLRLLADPATGPGDLIRPGHVLPLRAVAGGVRERPGHTEAAVDLCRLAGLPPVGVICELVEDDGTMRRLPSLRRLCDDTGLALVSIADLVAHLGVGGAPVEPLRRVERMARTVLPTRHGTFGAYGYRDRGTGAEHIVLVHPGTDGAASGADPLVRVHSECLTGDSFGSLRCDCGPQLEHALRRLAQEGGALVYLDGHEGRGIGLLAKLAAYQLQDSGLDTVAATMLADLGLHQVRLLTNNPAKVDGLRAHGIEVTRREGLAVGQTPYNAAYLQAKRDLMGHRLEVEDPVARQTVGEHTDEQEETA